MHTCMLSCSVVSNSCDPMNYSPSGSSVYGILHERILEWVAISSSGGSSWPRDRIRSLALEADSLPTEPPGKPLNTARYTLLGQRYNRWGNLDRKDVSLRGAKWHDQDIFNVLKLSILLTKLLAFFKWLCASTVSLARMQIPNMRAVSSFSHSLSSCLHFPSPHWQTDFTAGATARNEQVIFQTNQWNPNSCQ